MHNTDQFTVKEIDAYGHSTLDVVSQADKLNQWMYKTILPYCNGRILEIGSGIGTISHFFVTTGAHITLSDIRENYCVVLRDKFQGTPVKLIDLEHPEFDKEYAILLGTFDTVFALNVVEHIKCDGQALQNVYKLLKPRGQAVILVPAYQWLYNRFDVQLEHYRRYTKRSLSSLFVKAGFEVAASRYFNFAGILGWFVSGKLLRNNMIPEGQMSLYNTLVPLFRLADKAVWYRIGLSVICVGKK